MGAYMYPINIYTGKKAVKTEIVERLDSEVMQLKDFKELVKDSRFYFWANEEGEVNVTILFERLETDKEQNARIERETNYMKNYTEFQERNKSPKEKL